MRSSLLAVFVSLIIWGTALPSALAEDVIGKRSFSDQLVIPEPFVEDELTFPSLLYIRQPAGGGKSRSTITQIGGELKKRITQNLEASLSGAFDLLSADQLSRRSGFENLVVGLKEQFFQNDLHEAVASVALGWEVGGTGRRGVGAESFDIVNGALLVGKGFGDVPQRSLEPLAISGLLGVDIPTAARTEQHPDLLRWGAVLQYSLFYLVAVVGRVELPKPLDHMIPLVELDFQTALDRGESGKTTGTVNPGCVWVNASAQIGIEAVFPVNGRTGANMGVRASLRLPLETILGASAGRPLFGGGE